MILQHRQDPNLRLAGPLSFPLEDQYNLWDTQDLILSGVAKYHTTPTPTLTRPLPQSEMSFGIPGSYRNQLCLPVA